MFRDALLAATRPSAPANDNGSDLNPSARPPWVAVELRADLAPCWCVRPVNGIAYAQSACKDCHGAGVVAWGRGCVS